MQSQEGRTEASSEMDKSCPSASLAFVPDIFAIEESAGSGLAAASRRAASHRMARKAARRWFLDAQPLISIEWRLETQWVRSPDASNQRLMRSSVGRQVGGR